MKPARSGQYILMSGRATSSVTRPPPATTTDSPDCSGRSYVAFTNCTDASVNNGPNNPVTNVVEKSRRSESTNTTTSDDVAASERHNTSPLPSYGANCGSTSARCTTRAPAAAATEAVASLDPLSITTNSSTSGWRCTRSRQMRSTIRPTVASSLSAGRTTATDCEPLASR